MAPANVGERPAIGSRQQRAVDGGAEGIGGALQDGPVQISQHADVVIAVPCRRHWPSTARQCPAPVSAEAVGAEGWLATSTPWTAVPPTAGDLVIGELDRRRPRAHTHTHTQNWHASSTTPAGHGQEARRWAVITTTRECAVPSPMTWEGCMDMSDPSAGDIILNRGRRCRFRGRRHRQRPGGKPPERRACRGRLWAGWIVGARRFTGRAASRASNAVNLAALVGMANGIRAAVYLTRGGGRVPVESIRWHETPASEVLTRLNSDVNGLTEHEVSRRAVDSANGAFPTRPSLAASSRSWPTR
jgi:hypothetical protein